MNDECIICGEPAEHQGDIGPLCDVCHYHESRDIDVADTRLDEQIDHRYDCWKQQRRGEWN